MFPVDFKPSHKTTIHAHNAIYFSTTLSNAKVRKLLAAKGGIAKFLSIDKEAPSSWSTSGCFSDGRINGLPYVYNRQQCCSFTKNTQNWYLYPINRGELTNVGLEPDDLVEWIKCLNASKMGFKYSYFGMQPASDIKTSTHGSQISWNNQSGMVKDEFYWVGVEPCAKWLKEPCANGQVPYLHWIVLRYLINTWVTTSSLVPGKNLPYYMIPRATMLFHKKYGLEFSKAFFYAHLTGVYYSYYSLAYTDYMGLKLGNNDYSANKAPCVNLTATEFKKLWRNTQGYNMNTLLTDNNMFPTTEAGKKLFPKGLKLNTPYLEIDSPLKSNKTESVRHIMDLFTKGDYEGFIKHIESAHNPTKRKTIRKTNNLVKKNARKKTLSI